MFHNQTDNFAGGVGGKGTTGNKIEMQGQKCDSCELCFKVSEKKNINSNTLMGRKTY